MVSALGTSAPSMRMPIVPISAAVRPAARSPDSTRYVVVVLPAVPVIPTTVSRSDGLPYTVAATEPSTVRGAGCTSVGTVAEPPISATPAASVSTATAPRSIASAA